MRTNASFASSGRSPYASGLPLFSCEMTASSQAVHSVAACDRTPMSGSSIICEYAWSRPEIGGALSVGSRYESVRPAKSRNRAQASGKNRPTPPIQPVKLQPASRGHAEHEHPADPLRMPLRVRQRQRHPPRPAAQQPLRAVSVVVAKPAHQRTVAAPGWLLPVFLPATGGQVEPLVGAVDHVGAPRVAGVGVEDAIAAAQEGTEAVYLAGPPLPVRSELIKVPVVVLDRGHGRVEGDVEVVVKIAAERGVP